MLNAVNLSFVAFARSLGSMDGQVIVFFVMAVAAAEAAVGLAIILQLFRIRDDHQRRRGDDAAMVNVVATDLLRWIVLFPALGFLWNLFLGRRAAAGRASWSGPACCSARLRGRASLAVLRLHGLAASTRALHDVGLPLDPRRRASRSTPRSGSTRSSA